MPAFVVERISDPTDAQLDAILTLFEDVFHNDATSLSLTGGNLGLLRLYGQSIVRPALVVGEVYAAVDSNSGTILGFVLWIPPNVKLLSTPELRKLGYDEFWERLSAEGKHWHETVYANDIPEFTKGCLKQTGHATWWWLNIAAVRDGYRGQGIATALIKPVREKAASRGNILALSTATPGNVPIYQALSFKLMGDSTVHSPWADWPIYVFSSDPQHD